MNHLLVYSEDIDFSKIMALLEMITNNPGTTSKCSKGFNCRADKARAGVDFPLPHDHERQGNGMATLADFITPQEHAWRRADSHYRYGACVDLAVAFAERLSLPVAFLLDAPEDRCRRGHAFVLDGEYAIDIRGRRSLNVLKEEWKPEYGAKMTMFVTPSLEVARSLAEAWRPPFHKLGEEQQWADILLAQGFESGVEAA